MPATTSQSGDENMGSIDSGGTKRGPTANATPLRDVTEIADDAGFPLPAALTPFACDDCLTWSEGDDANQDDDTRLWTILSMAGYALRTMQLDKTDLIIEVLRIPRDGDLADSHWLSLKFHLGADECGEPLIIVSVPERD